MAEIASRPYRLGEGCCEACVFGRGSHNRECILWKEAVELTDRLLQERREAVARSDPRK